MRTKEEAETLGRKLLARMKGTGWKLRIWNGGTWEYSVSLGALTVYPSPEDDKYSALMSDDPEDLESGSAVWVCECYSDDPNEVVAAQICLARESLKELDALVAQVEVAQGKDQKKT